MPQPVNGSTDQRAEADEPSAVDSQSSWMETVREIHRLAASTHATYQRTMTDVHLAYLSAVDRSLSHGASPVAGAGVPGTRSATPPAAAPIVVPLAPPPDLPDLQHFTPDVDSAGSVSSSANGNGAEPSTSAGPAEAPGTSAGEEQQNGTSPRAKELIALTLEIVAEKTGYPVEILRPDMHLQADLGIDSIKRVEVLSALRDRVEGLSTIDAGELGRLQSIGEIAERLVAEVGG